MNWSHLDFQVWGWSLVVNWWILILWVTVSGLQPQINSVFISQLDCNHRSTGSLYSNWTATTDQQSLYIPTGLQPQINRFFIFQLDCNHRSTSSLYPNRTATTDPLSHWWVCFRYSTLLLSVTKIPQIWSMVNESIDWMIINRGKMHIKRNTCPNTTLYTTNPTETGMGWNAGSQGNKQVTNCLLPLHSLSHHWFIHEHIEMVHGGSDISWCHTTVVTQQQNTTILIPVWTARYYVSCSQSCSSSDIICSSLSSKNSIDDCLALSQDAPFITWANQYLTLQRGVTGTARIQ